VSQEAAEQKAKEIAGLTIELVGVEANNLELVSPGRNLQSQRGDFPTPMLFAAALAKIQKRGNS